MTIQPDDRPPMAIAMQWVSQITTISLIMVLPAGLGYWLDNRWDTEPWLIACGAAIGFAIGMWQLLQLVKTDQEKSKSDHERRKNP